MAVGQVVVPGEEGERMGVGGEWPGEQIED